MAIISLAAILVSLVPFRPIASHTTIRTDQRPLAHALARRPSISLRSWRYVTPPSRRPSTIVSSWRSRLRSSRHYHARPADHPWAAAAPSRQRLRLQLAKATATCPPHWQNLVNPCSMQSALLLHQQQSPTPAAPATLPCRAAMAATRTSPATRHTHRQREQALSVCSVPVPPRSHLLPPPPPSAPPQPHPLQPLYPTISLAHSRVA